MLQDLSSQKKKCWKTFQLKNNHKLKKLPLVQCSQVCHKKSIGWKKVGEDFKKALNDKITWKLENNKTFVAADPVIFSLHMPKSAILMWPS